MAHPGCEMRVIAVARSRVKGVPKDPEAWVRLLREHGVEGDAHAGPGPREVSVLAVSSIREMEQRLGESLGFGRFGENVVVDGSLEGLEVGDLMGMGAAVLEVTAIGKECHEGCAIRVKTGDCIMPRAGLFARVVAGGVVRAGDPVRIRRPSQEVAVVVLAGGRSRRFGTDKRFTKAPSGNTLLQAAVETARAVTPMVVVSVGVRDSTCIEGVTVVHDEIPEFGPLGGIVSALHACAAPRVAVFAVDQPGVTADLLRFLVARMQGAGVCLKWGDDFHPLPCVLDRQMVLPVLEEAAALRKLALREAFEQAGVVALDAESVRDLGEPADLLANWNEPGDQARAVPK